MQSRYQTHGIRKAQDIRQRSSDRLAARTAQTLYSRDVINVPIDAGDLAAYCRDHRIARLSVFGSALRDDFGPESDVDLLIRFDDDAAVSLFDFVAVADELSTIFGRNVDLGDERGLVVSGDPSVRDAILRTAVPLYVAP